MAHRWLLIEPDEDGNPCSWLTETELEDRLANAADYGVRQYLDQVPDNTDPNYWPDGTGLLLKVEIVVPRPATTAFELP